MPIADAGLDCFEGFLVTYDEACELADIPKPGEQPALEGGNVHTNECLQSNQNQPKEHCAQQRPHMPQFKRPLQVKPALTLTAETGENARPIADPKPKVPVAIKADIRTGAKYFVNFQECTS